MEKNKFYIYCHRKLTDGKCFYIGKGCGLRYKQKTNRNPFWNNIVNKHGFESVILVNNISEQKAFELESYFIKTIKIENLSNFREEQGRGGFSHSEETKRKISQTSTGQKRSEETKQKMRKPKPKGFGDIFRGKSLTQEHCSKISEGKKGKGCKIVYQYDKQNNLLNTFPSTKHASDFIKVHPVNMISHLNGKYKTCRGFIFKYNKL
jgi:group I intron endonuclease